MSRGTGNTRMSDMLEKARDEIVFALKKPMLDRPVREDRSPPKEVVRLPVKAEACDLESAIDDMIVRFPETLDYLGK